MAEARHRIGASMRPTSSIPGPFESGLPSVYYIAPPDPELVRGGPARLHSGRSQDLFGISVHEVWPGHYLQRLHASRSREPYRPALPHLGLRRGLGALRRADDVGCRPGQRRSRRCASGSCSTR